MFSHKTIDTRSILFQFVVHVKEGELLTIFATGSDYCVTLMIMKGDCLDLFANRNVRSRRHTITEKSSLIHVPHSSIDTASLILQFFAEVNHFRFIFLTIPLGWPLLGLL